MTPTIEHPIAGTLTYDDRVGWYATEVSPGVTLAGVPREGDDPLGALFDRVAADWQLFGSEAAQHAAEALVDLKNGSWLEDEEDEVSPEAFRARLALRTVVVDGDGADFSFDDGDLFWGHTVMVDMDAAITFSNAQIAG